MLQSKTIIGKTTGPHLLITAGVHGDEFEPMAAVRRLIGRIDADSLRGKVTLVPCVNVAAYRRGARTADDGLDLARVCPGNQDGSITERVAHQLSLLIRSADAYIDLHTGGSVFRLAPLSGYVLHPDPRVLATQRQMSLAFNLPINLGHESNAERARSLSVARDAKVPAIYTETGGGGSCDAASIDDCVQGCINVMASLGMMQPAPCTSHVKYIVEDPRDNSGHLQIQHPSPMEGFFDPLVELGQPIKQGDRIGTVCDVWGERVETVCATETGIVLMLRWFRHVNAGDALAAILPSQFSRTEGAL